MRLRAATMFSGIGAPEVARPDWDWRWCAEIEKFPAAVHALRHSQGGRLGNRETPNLGDVSAPDLVERAKSEGAIDVLVFGSPCQSFSVAGKRLGLDDPRGNLALISLEIARRLRPRWLVFENVPGLLSSDNGRDFGIFLRVMEQCGYFGAWRILDAQYAGVPQRRRRVFFVGYLGDWRPAAAVLFEPESLRGDTPPSREAGKGVAGCAQGLADGGDWPARVAPTLKCAVREVAVASDHAPAIAFSCKDHGGDAGDFSPTLRAMTHGESHANGGGQVAVASDHAVRRLTPRECERLQGFPDDFTAIPWRGKSDGQCPDGPRYKALGNSMAVPVMAWILGRIETFEKRSVGRPPQLNGEAAIMVTGLVERAVCIFCTFAA